MCGCSQIKITPRIAEVVNGTPGDEANG
jgi:hypothetical protein